MLYILATRFPLEIQLLHFNTQYGDPESAMGHPDGFAGLVTLFQMDVSPGIGGSSSLEIITEVVANITEPGSSLILDMKVLQQFQYISDL